MVNGLRKTILAVDDERSNLLVINRILSSQYNVLFAKTGMEALAKAREEAPDLILLDVMLPDINGYDVLRELKGNRETCEIPVIIVSAGGAAEMEDGSRCTAAVAAEMEDGSRRSAGAEEAGADLGSGAGWRSGTVRYIQKPFNGDRLLTCVKTYVGAQDAMECLDAQGEAPSCK